MKAESIHCDIGPVFVSDAVSGDAHADDNFSDEEHETEFEALQHLPPDERRKALRRLRNRESARRVRARRLAEMSQMEAAMRTVKDENANLKAHVSKLQSHIQSMTMKVYEITAKYESTVADNAQLRMELQRLRRPSAPGGYSFTGPASCTNLSAVAPGPSSAPLQVSPFTSPCGAGPGAGADSVAPDPNQQLSAGHAQLRSSSPMDLQQQRQALEEVVHLLKEHKRKNQLASQNRSAGSEMGSSGAAANPAATATTTTALNNAHSPNSDNGVGCVIPMFAGTVLSCGTGGAADAGGGVAAAPTSMTEGHLSYGGGGVGPYMGVHGMGRGGPCDMVSGLHLQQQQLQQELQAQSAGDATEAGLCHLGLSCGMEGARLPTLPTLQQPQQQQPQQLQWFMQDHVASAPAPLLQAMANQRPQQLQQQQHHLQHQHQQHLQQQHQQAQQQSLSQPLTQLQVSQPGSAVQTHSYPQLPQSHQQEHQQQALAPRQRLQEREEPWLGTRGLDAQSAAHNAMSSLSAPFCTMPPSMPPAALPCPSNNAMQLPAHASGPCAQGPCGGAGYGPEPGGQGGGNNHRSASFALEQRPMYGASSAVSAGFGYQHNLEALRQSGWHPASLLAARGVGVYGAVGGMVGELRPEDIPEDVYMSLEDDVPQDL